MTTDTEGQPITVEEYRTRQQELLWLTRLRSCMNRWAARYAESAHAQKHVKETRLLIQEIDERILAL